MHDAFDTRARARNPNLRLACAYSFAKQWKALASISTRCLFVRVRGSRRAIKCAIMLRMLSNRIRFLRLFAVFVTAYCSACKVVMPSAAAQSPFPELPLALELLSTQRATPSVTTGAVTAGALQLFSAGAPPPNRAFRDLYTGGRKQKPGGAGESWATL
jgi:hypothetical protein